MKKKHSRKTFYYMLFSYTLVVLLIAAAILAASIYFLREVIYGEIGKFNERVLQSTSEKIHSNIISPINAAWLDLALSAEKSDMLQTPNLTGDNLAMLEIHNTLKSSVNRHSVVDRIHIYYREENIMLSSNYGYKEFSTRGFTGDYAWLPDALSGNGISCFSESGAGASTEIQNYLAFTFTYPFGASEERASCNVIIVVEERQIRALLDDAFDTNFNSAFITNDAGVVISSLESNTVFSEIPEEMLKWIDRSAPYGIRNFTQDGADYIFSCHKINGADWYLVNTVSIQSFYRPYFTTRFYFIALAVLVVLAGVQIAVLFSRLFYSPIQKLARKAAESFGAEVREKRNEFYIIEDAIDNMSLRIDNLQTVLRVNAPIMKQNFLQYLLKDGHYPPEEIARRLHLFELPADYPLARCFLVDFDSVPMKGMSLEEHQVIRLGIVECLNDADPEEGWFCIAGEASETTAVGALCYLDAGATPAMAHISEVCGEAFLRLSVGGEVDGLSLLRQSREQARETARYGFLLPERYTLCWEDVVHRHESAAVLPPALFGGLPSDSDSPDADALSNWICQVLDALKHGDYSIQYVHKTIMELLQLLASTSKHSTDREQNAARQRLYTSFAEMDSIDYLRDWITDYIRSVHTQRESAASKSTVEHIRDYVEENLAGDLSLETVASHVYISPKYLSRIFKDATGENLSDYITNRRIMEARRLLEETRLSVEEITAKVGYNSSAYFIRRFREFCGCTPKQYRRQSLEKTV